MTLLFASTGVSRLVHLSTVDLVIIVFYFALVLAIGFYLKERANLTCAIVTVLVSLLTKPKPEVELTGLVYGLTAIPHEEHVSIFHRPVFWAAVVGAIFVALNIIFW